MSFFGALFAGVTLLSKGISKGQDIAEDRELKKRSQQLGKDTYYDHKGVMHDAVTGRAITYHTDPFTGHRLIQDAYTLNTIRDLTAEERFEEIKENKRKAEENGELFYEAGSPIDVLGRKELTDLRYKYKWRKGCGFRERKKNKYGNYTDEFIFSLDNMRIQKVGSYYTKIYKKEMETIKYIKEQVDWDMYYYTNLETGMAVDVDNDTKKKLEELGIETIDFIHRINEIKEEYAKLWHGEIPMSANL